MKKLAILRHAKSSWAEPGISDKERPLNKKGLKQLGVLGEWLTAQSWRPDHIFCSTAQRTRETYAGLQPVLGDCDVDYLPSLYMGHIEDYLGAIWNADDAKSVLLIGHNPTCDDLVRYLAKTSSPAMDKLMASHFSTGTFAGFDVGVEDWADVGVVSCTLTHFIRPKDIMVTL